MKEERVELHLKYRPKTFDELVSNDVLKKSVLDVIDRTRTFLFYGPRGCGKTTIARLIANYLNVADIDLSEIDAADNTGVDDARKIKEAAQYSPLGGKFKIYIIDEIHRLSKNAFDSLLKTLEEPPPHCYFVFATTDISKVPVTIKSRAKCYEVKPFTPEEANEFIKYICRKEGFRVAPAVRQAILDSFQEERDYCIPREILVALDLVRNVENEEDAKQLIRANVRYNVINLCRALLAQESWPVVAKILDGLADDAEQIRVQIVGYMSKVLLSTNGSKADLAAGIINNFEKPYLSYGAKGILAKDCYYSVKN